MKRLAAAACVFLSACATTGGGSGARTYDFGSYAVITEQAGCSVNTAKLVSKGPAVPVTTLHTLTIGASGTTSAVFGVNCEPAFAGGNSMCLVLPQGIGMSAASAGIGCGGWDQYNMVRN